MDWIGAALNILGLWLLPKRKYAALFVFLFSNVAFMIWATTAKNYAILILQGILTVLNVRTYIIWRQQDGPK